MKLLIKNMVCPRCISAAKASVGHIPVGSYTIVEEKYGKVSKSGEEGLWGRIKSEQPYNGKYVPVWICLSYTEKV